MNRFKNKIVLNPIMVYIILIAITIVSSSLLTLVGFESTYYTLNTATQELQSELVTAVPLFNLSGIKYIFSSTVSNFVAFTPLSMLIISLIGIGLMEKTGFLKLIFTLFTRKLSKNTITFIVVLIGMLSSIAGDLGYVILIPITALLFLHGRRNPIIGIVASYAGLTVGTGLSIFFTSVDTAMLTQTLNSANLISTIKLGTFIYILIMTITILIVSALITYITETYIANKVKKYEFKEEKTEYKIGKKEYRGLLLATIGGALYLIIIIYSIIPGLPLSGSFLDHSQTYYIDKLFSSQSFFGDGFVFVVTIFFIILGFLYGIGSKSIKNHNDFCKNLSHSLDGTGKTLILILFASVLINVFKVSRIGTVIVSGFSEILNNITFGGIPLIITLILISAISNIFVTSGTTKWSIISVAAVPAFMNSGLSPEFSQLIMRFGESITTGITPIFAYFVIYLGFIEKYNQGEEPVSLFTAIRYQIPYSVIVGIVFMLILSIWYITGLPLGIGGYPIN